MEPAGTPDLDAALDLPKVRAQIDAALAELTERYRRVIALRFFEDRTREQCAEILDVTVPTFDVLLLRSLRAFRKAWEARDDR
jgi:RNA polymerase sigma factor (sigma-70 family)